MSAETSEWLNKFCLIGNTANRGKAWHYLKGADNHWDEGVPADEVLSRLADWTPDVVPLTVDYNGVSVTDPNKSVIVRPAFNGLDAAVIGVHSAKYDHHDGFAPMVRNATNLIDDDEVVILSAGLLKNGARFWVQIGKLDTTSVAGGGDTVIPYITFSNALDGTSTNRVDSGMVRVVCDNTLSASISGAVKTHRTKHTKNSRQTLHDVRDALDLMQSSVDTFDKEVQGMLDYSITEMEFEKLVDAIAPLEKDMSKRAMTRTEKKRDSLNHLWSKDAMVAPLDNSLYKFVQTMNTYETHHTQVRNQSRGEKNMLSMVSGGMYDLDQRSVSLAQKTLGRDLVLV